MQLCHCRLGKDIYILCGNFFLLFDLDSGNGKRLSICSLDYNTLRLLKKLDVMTQKDAKVRELERLVEFLKRENDRLGHACDDADDEVGSLKKQIFELTHTIAKLEAEKVCHKNKIKTTNDYTFGLFMESNLN